MSTTVKLDAGIIAKEMEKRVVLWINKALQVLLKELQRLTPEDTGNMLNSYEVENAKSDWNQVVGIIRNNADYAIYVERWVSWLTFTYHKPKWKPFYDWIGNRTFARAVDNKRDEVIKIIFTEIDR